MQHQRQVLVKKGEVAAILAAGAALMEARTDVEMEAFEVLL